MIEVCLFYSVSVPDIGVCYGDITDPEDFVYPEISCKQAGFVPPLSILVVMLFLKFFFFVLDLCNMRNSRAYFAS